MSDKFELYPFNTAEMEMTDAEFISPIYRLTVTGDTRSLGPIIQPINIKRIVNGFLRIEVLGRDTKAIGTVEYSKSIDIQKNNKTKGIMIVGANKREKLVWSDY